MKTAYISLQRLRQTKPAIKFAENIPDAARLAIARYGVFFPVILNRTTGNVLNPIWLRAIIEMDSPLDTLPCAILELSAQDEIGAAIILNGGIEGLLYNIPEDNIRPYLQDCMTNDRAGLLAMLPDPHYWHSFFNNEAAAPAPRLAGLPIEELNIPMLDIQHQAQALTAEITAWNSNSRRRSSPAAYHFYVDDFRFSALAKKPDTLPENVQLVVEPNFSTHAAQPGAAAIYDIWQKRSMSRLWQQRGVKVIVDMNVERRFLKLNLEGVPQGWKAYANRAYVDDFEHLFIAHEFARAHAGSDIIYLVYGGPKSRELCQKYGWIWLDAGKTLDGRGYGTRN